jgi:hypothetical protein
MNAFWHTLGKILNGAWFYDNYPVFFNWAFIILGFVGFAYWMRWQYRFNKQAEQNPNQIK